MASILVVGDDPILLETRVDLLSGWHVSRATSRDAIQAIQSIEPDLVILCETISGDIAKKLAKRARETNPSVIVMAIFRGGAATECRDADLRSPVGRPRSLEKCRCWYSAVRVTRSVVSVYCG